jgi:hypothetical protein
MNWPIRWSRIKIEDEVSKEELDNAKKKAKKHSKGKIKSLPFTESIPEWVILYDHARMGQIDPDVMKLMRRRDLKFLAGHVFPHPALTQPRESEENYDPRTSSTPPPYDSSILRCSD